MNKYYYDLHIHSCLSPCGDDDMTPNNIAGMAALMGHKAATICTIIAQRIALDACTDYKPFVRQMIATALDKLATL